MNLTRCHWQSTDKALTNSRVQRKWRKVFALALWNLSVEIYQLKEENIFNDTKVLWRENPENCVRNPSPQTQMCKESLKAYKLFFGFRDCLLINTFSIGIKVSSRNSASETFTTYFEMYSEAWPLHIFNAEWKLSSLFLSQQCWEFDWFHGTELFDHFMQIIFLTYNFG